MKNKYLAVSGLCMLLAGISILLSEYTGAVATKILVTTFFVIGGYLAYRFSRSITGHNVGRQFHMLQAMGMPIFGILVAMLPNSLEGLTTYATFFIMCFGLLEIGFVFMFFNTGLKVKWNIVIYRLVSGFLSVVGGLIILFGSLENQKLGLLIVGVLMAIRGLTFVLLAPKLKID